MSIKAVFLDGKNLWWRFFSIIDHLVYTYHRLWASKTTAANPLRYHIIPNKHFNHVHTHKAQSIHISWNEHLKTSNSFISFILTRSSDIYHSSIAFINTRPSDTYNSKRHLHYILPTIISHSILSRPIISHLYYRWTTTTPATTCPNK